MLLIIAETFLRRAVNSGGGDEKATVPETKQGCPHGGSDARRGQKHDGP